MPTIPANPQRFSRNYSEFRTTETDSETRFLATANYYGINLERNVLALDWSRLSCESCGHEAEDALDQGVAFTRTFAEVALECPKCGKKAWVPKAYAPDLVASRKRRIVIEIYGEKSSVNDPAKMGFYRENGFTAVTVPNIIADNSEYSKPIFQLLALVCASDHPGRLFMSAVWPA